METCLAEVTEAMVKARTVNDTAVDLLNNIDGMRFNRVLEWPEELDWIDDDKNNVDLAFNFE
jgi:hypothetical protein